VAGFVYIQRHWSRECDVIKGAELTKWHYLNNLERLLKEALLLILGTVMVCRV
jgi:hypothetical protein